MTAVAADVLSDKFFEPPDCHILLRVNSQAMFYQQCRRYALSLDLFPIKMAAMDLAHAAGRASFLQDRHSGMVSHGDLQNFIRPGQKILRRIHPIPVRD